MARNREPVLKRAKALGIELSTWELIRNRRDRFSRAEERRASTVFS